MPHAVADEFGQLLPLGAPVEVEALLGDALGVVLAGVPVHSLPPHAFLTQPPRPLHALLPQQGVIGLLVAARLVAPVLCVLAVVNADRHLGLLIMIKSSEKQKESVPGEVTDGRWLGMELLGGRPTLIKK